MGLRRWVPLSRSPTTVTRLILAAGLVGVPMVYGCVSPEERIAKERAECVSYGFLEGSTEMANCVLALEQSRRMQLVPVFTTGVVGGVGHW